MSYWRGGEPMTSVKAENGIPIQFTLEGKVYVIEKIARRRRLDDPLAEPRLFQDRFKVRTTNGGLLIIAHDLMADTWFAIRKYG